MANTLFIQEYAGQGAVNRGNASTMGEEPATVSQTVTIGTVVSSNPFGKNTTMVRLVSDAGCSVAFGANPTATTGSMYIPPNVICFFGVVPGHSVSVIANS